VSGFVHNDNAQGIRPMKTALQAAVAATLLAASHVALADPPAKTLDLAVLGSYASGLFDDGGAEITSYDPATRRAFVVNAGDGTVDVLGLADPAQPVSALQLDVAADIAATLPGATAGAANSVALKNGILAVAVENDDKQANGWVAFYSTSDLAAGLAGLVEVGALPDMVTFDGSGQYVLTANEGEPNSYGQPDSVDPRGSVSVINIAGGVAGATAMTAGFEAWDGQEDALRAQGIRIYGPGASASQDLEPEYIATAGTTAWVTLQENNALAVVDIPTATVQAIVPLGYKDHSKPGNGIDASDRDDAINIRPWNNVLGMYQPDSIASYQYRGRTFLVTANEGDARDYDGFAEEARARVAGTTVADAADNAKLGRLTVTTSPPGGDLDNLYVLGGRSISIWSAGGDLLWDSGDALERITAAAFPDAFNATNDENDTFDNRSDNKGPEPEGVAIGKVEGRTYAFVGLERIGGIAVYDITNPYAPVYMDYLNNRDFDPSLDCSDLSASDAPCGDLGPEGLHFVSKEDSPTGEALLIVGNEVSGTTTIYQVDVKPAKAQGPQR
jgi:hypothetical protein